MELQGSLPSHKLKKKNSTGYYVNGYATDTMDKV
jgi:hypothetical protein